MEQKFNWKRLLITVLIVVVTAGAVGGTTWYVMDAQSKKDKTETDRQLSALEKQVSELKTPTKAATTTGATITVATDATANWKTYSNSTHSFSFKYPNLGYSIDASTVNQSEIPLLKFTSTLVEDSLKNGYEYPGEFTFQVWDANGKTDFTSWINQRDAHGNNRLINYRDGSIKETTIAGVFKYKFLDDGMTTYTDYALIKNDKVYILGTIKPESNVVKDVIKTIIVN